MSGMLGGLVVKELIDAYPLNEPLYIVVVVVVHALNLPREVVLVLVVLAVLVILAILAILAVLVALDEHVLA